MDGSTSVTVTVSGLAITLHVDIPAANLTVRVGDSHHISVPLPPSSLEGLESEETGGGRTRSAAADAPAAQSAGGSAVVENFLQPFDDHFLRPIDRPFRIAFGQASIPSGEIFFPAPSNVHELADRTIRGARVDRAEEERVRLRLRARRAAGNEPCRPAT